MEKTFDVRSVRDQFPALQRTQEGRRVTYFDGPGGSQVVKPAIEAVSRYMESGNADLHYDFATSRETRELVHDARQAAAGLLGAQDQEIAFGANMTTLTFAIARSLAREWDSDSEVVVTELDHRANVDPWALAAAERGAKVRWIRVDPDTLTLDLSGLEETINENTELVAAGLASNAVGTVNDVTRISRHAREVGAAVAVDAVHAAPHIPIDRDEIGADILTCSAYKFFGPHVGVTAIRGDLFERMRTYKVDPAPEHIPEKLETGMLNHEGIAGVKAAIDFISTLGNGNSERERIADGMRNIESYEGNLADMFRSGLREIPGVTLYTAPDDIRKTPTVAFRVEGCTPGEVCERMAREGFFVSDGDFYASTLAERLGVRDRGGWVRVGLAPYTTRQEIDAFLEAMRSVTG